MKVLVAGGAGYVGSILIPHLLKEGYAIICLDKLFFGEEPIESFRDEIELINEDIRTFNPSILEDIDICINLAAISQPDQTKTIHTKLYYEINHKGCVRLANLCKEKGVKRFIFTSTCSVYGFQRDLITEKNDPNPLEAYGKSKVLAERDILNLADNNFSVTILRPGTMYGFSPKMRFDLVVNGMVWALHKTKKINVMRDGMQWRPVVHVNDVVTLISKLIKTNKYNIQKEIFNVGSNEQNYQIRALAELIGDSIGIDYELGWYGERDSRSYQVDFSKLRNKLGFKFKHTVPEAANDIYNALNEKRMIKDEKTSVINWYKKLSNDGVVKLLYS